MSDLRIPTFIVTLAMTAYFVWLALTVWMMPENFLAFEKRMMERRFEWLARRYRRRGYALTFGDRDEETILRRGRVVGVVGLLIFLALLAMEVLSVPTLLVIAFYGFVILLLLIDALS